MQNVNNKKTLQARIYLTIFPMKHIFVYKREDASLIGASSSPNRRVHREKFLYINIWYFYSIFLFLHLL